MKWHVRALIQLPVAHPDLMATWCMWAESSQLRAVREIINDGFNGHMVYVGGVVPAAGCPRINK